jgi:dCMP deaminase
MSERDSWDTYFLEMAAHAASRSTCVRRKVGAVVAQDNRVRSTGYNGGPSGYGHCSEGACPRGRSDAPSLADSVDLAREYGDCIAIHAEANALLHCETLHRRGATLYCTDFPCFQCAKLISNSGISRVVYAGGFYEGADAVVNFMRDCRVLVVGDRNG